MRWGPICMVGIVAGCTRRYRIGAGLTIRRGVSSTDSPTKGTRTMRPTLVIVLLAGLLSAASFSTQGDQRMALRAQSPVDQRMARLNPGLRQWLRQESHHRLDGDLPLDEASLREALTLRLAGQDYSSMDIDGLLQILMSQLAHDADADLREQMRQMQAANKEKRAQREQIGQRRAASAESSTTVQRSAYAAR
jgi:hypothetical protein